MIKGVFGLFRNSAIILICQFLSVCEYSRYKIMILKILFVGILLLDFTLCDDYYRLKSDVVPSHYEITITPYFDTQDEKAYTFDGEVRITLRTSANGQNNLTLHALYLDFEEAIIQKVGASSSKSVSYVFDEKYEFVHISLESNLDVNVDYELFVKYRGKLRDDNVGFYKSSYLESGITKWLGATQMQGTHARKVFPCFDEPKFKATFDLIIDRPISYKPTLANTKLKAYETLVNGLIREKFFTTPIMSTYLVAFLVSEFEASRYTIEDNQEYGVWARPEARDQGEYAFDIGKKVVKALSEYFKIDYYSSDENLKLDHIGLPDFAAGAMENWGLIKYREGYLMYDPTESPPSYEYRIAQIVAHETTHMWFGDLVTCHWWGDGWLNEGFATYFQNYILTEIAPKLKTESVAVIVALHEALDSDQGEDPPPTSNQNVFTPDEISKHFGIQTYQKPGSVLRMLKHLIGEEAFREGLHRHLNASRFKAVEPDDLYVALQSSVDDYEALAAYPTTTIAGFMKPWIDQSGYPIVQVDVNYENSSVTLKQKRFYINESLNSDELYPIPITYTTALENNFADTKPKLIFKDREITFNVTDLNDGWIIFNIQSSGVFRVNYDEKTWNLITETLKENLTTIHYHNRASIVNDIFALAEAEHITFERLYSILEFLEDEEDFFVWAPAINGLTKLRAKLKQSEDKAELDKFAIKLIKKIETKLGFVSSINDSHITLRERTDVLNYACNIVKDDECVASAVKIFEEFKRNGTYIEPSIRPAAYCAGLREGTEEHFNILFERLKTTNVANEEITIRAALGCTSDKKTLENLLKETLMETVNIRVQDKTTVLANILRYDENVEPTMKFVMENIEAIKEANFSLTKLLSSFPPLLDSCHLEEFEDWLQKCEVCKEANEEKDLKTALTASKAQLDWTESHLNDIIQPLKTKNSSPLSMVNMFLFITVLASQLYLM